ncbi:MAG: 16S rRNA (guanine(966)-N(2))-methyltransferase RsmD [Firmicutes bacterium]|nr:16S rRNA (guanine(966)-N(2))-methyltransferase RsmD [Bacillota bacterium]
MRIIAGKFKGRQLQFPADKNVIRPTMDRVKESIFNILFGQIEDAKVLDLFSGTGALGLEALSRGAKHITFVDHHKDGINFTFENIKSLIPQMPVHSNPTKMVGQNIGGFIRTDLNEHLALIWSDWQKAVYNLGLSHANFNIIFLDPPHTLENPEQIAIEVLPLLSNSGMVVFKTESEKYVELFEKHFSSVDLRDYNNNIVYFLSK